MMRVDGDLFQVGPSVVLLLCFFLQLKEIDGMTTTGNIFVNKTSNHNECEGITSVVSFPFRVGGDTTMASFQIPLNTVENPIEDPSCGQQGTFSDYNMTSPALWYMIEGNDHYVKAVIENADHSEQPFALFKGFDCGTKLECIEHVAEDRNNLLTWFAERGTMYYFKVFGDPEGEDRLFVLDFMSSENPRPSNDQCEFAQPLQWGESVTGMTTGAWPLAIEVEECNLGRHSQALFYSVQGTGMDLEVALRADVTEGMLGLAVVGGENCSQCIVHSKYMSAVDSQQTVSFPSKKGTLYKIIVSGEDVFDAGVFHLTIRDDQVAGASSGSFSLIFNASLMIFHIFING